MGVDRVLLDVQRVADRAMPERASVPRRWRSRETCFWSAWTPSPGGSIRPQRLDELVDRDGLAARAARAR